MSGSLYRKKEFHRGLLGEVFGPAKTGGVKHHLGRGGIKPSKPKENIQHHPERDIGKPTAPKSE